MRSTDSKPENFNDAFKHSIAFFLAFPKERVKPNHLLGWMMQIKACKNQIGSSRAESQSKKYLTAIEKSQKKFLCSLK